MAIDERAGLAGALPSVLRMLAASSAQPRVAMRGTSMTPLLAEPMVLTLGPAGPGHRIGEVVVFERDGQLVAHRVTGLRGGVLQTCGDAVPWSPEYPDPATIVGKVVAVSASDAPAATRIDGWYFSLRGVGYARLRSLRAFPFRMRALWQRVVRAMPWLRSRPYVALVQAMSADVRGDAGAFERALGCASAGAIVATTRRHGCSAALVDAISSMNGTSPAATHIRRGLQGRGRAVVLRGMAARAHVAEVAAKLSHGRVRFALLKGAARLYADEPGAMLHPSSDFDVLVPADELDAAAAILRSHGYTERADEELKRRYRDFHHAAPLYPSGWGYVVELHRGLAPPGTLSLRLDWEALVAHLIAVDGPAGPVRMLDPFGTALHYAVHSLGLRRLRDSVLLANALLRLTEPEREHLRSLLASETTDPIRLAATAVLAARIAGLPWPASGAVENYLRWVMRREDMPLFFNWRSQLTEGWYAAGSRFTQLTMRLLDPRAGLGGVRGGLPMPAALAGRCVASALAFSYATMMRPPR